MLKIHYISHFKKKVKNTPLPRSLDTFFFFLNCRWTAHLLQLGVQGVSRALVSKTRMLGPDAVSAPLNIDQVFFFGVDTY